MKLPLLCLLPFALITLPVAAQPSGRRGVTDEGVIALCIHRSARGKPWLEKTLWGLPRCGVPAMTTSAFETLGASGYLKLLVTMLLWVGLSACEPSYSVSWSKDFDKPIQIACISDALKSVAKNVSYGSYVSDGARGFPRGTKVIQLGYPDPNGGGHFDYDVGRIDASRTRIHHSFDKVGNRPSDEYLRKSAALLTRNNEAVSAKCDLRFSPKDFRTS